MELVILGLVALFVTKLVDTLRNLIDPDGTKPKVLWNLASIAFAVLLCIMFSIDGTGALGTSTLGTLPAEIITGLIVAGMSAANHELLDLASAMSHERKRRNLP